MMADIKEAGLNTEVWTEARLLTSISVKFKNLKEGARKTQAAAKELRLAKKKMKAEGAKGFDVNGTSTPSEQQSNQPQGETENIPAAAAEPESAAAARDQEEDGDTEAAVSGRGGRRTRVTRGAAAAAAAPASEEGAAAPKGRKATAAAADRSGNKQRDSKAAGAGNGSSTKAAAGVSVPSLDTLDSTALVALLVAAAKKCPDFAEQVQAAMHNKEGEQQ